MLTLHVSPAPCPGGAQAPMGKDRGVLAPHSDHGSRVPMPPHPPPLHPGRCHLPAATPPTPTSLPAAPSTHRAPSPQWPQLPGRVPGRGWGVLGGRGGGSAVPPSPAVPALAAPSVYILSPRSVYNCARAQGDAGEAGMSRAWISHPAPADGAVETTPRAVDGGLRPLIPTRPRTHKPARRGRAHPSPPRSRERCPLAFPPIPVPRSTQGPQGAHCQPPPHPSSTLPRSQDGAGDPRGTVDPLHLALPTPLRGTSGCAGICHPQGCHLG